MAIKPEQSRLARGILGWTQETLARIVGLTHTSIDRFEKGQAEFRPATIAAMEKAFANMNVDFPDELSVRRDLGVVQILKGYNALTELWDDIFFALKDKGGEVLILNVDEGRTGDIEQKNLTRHLERLKENKITERLLSCEGDENFVMPREYYRWLPKDLYSPTTSTYLYDGRVAMQIWGEDMIILIRNNTAYESEKKKFEHLWKGAVIPAYLNR